MTDLAQRIQDRTSRLLRRIREEKRTYGDAPPQWERLPDVLDLPDLKEVADRQETRARLASIFKSYDIRGVVTAYPDPVSGERIPVNLGPGIAERIGRALAAVSFPDLPGSVKGLEAGDCFVLGRDNGTTSPALLEGLARGLTRSGINAIVVEEGCTGEVYGMIPRLGAKGGIMITRSHVEKEYNGMKIVLGREALHSRFIERIRDAVFEGRAVRREPAAARIGGVARDARALYRDVLVREYGSLLRQGRSPVAINFGGGTARLYLDAFEELLGERLVKTFRVESDPDARGGLPDPTQPRYLEEQMAWSRAHPEATVFNFDLDADRVSALMGGTLFLGDLLAFPLAAYKLEVERPALLARLEEIRPGFDREEVSRLAGTVLADPRCTKQLTQLVERLGGVAVQHRIGHSHIKSTMNRMMESLAAAAGFDTVAGFVERTGYVMWQAEYSLHFFGTDSYGIPSDDALRFLLKLVSVLDSYSRAWDRPALTVPEFLDRLKSRNLFDSFFQAPEIRTVYDDAEKARVVSRVEREFRELAGRSGWQLAGMDVLGDGFRLDTPDGFILFRHSNTSPKLTMRIEARDRDRWLEYFHLLFRSYNRVRKPEYTLDMQENAFLRDRLGITDPDGIR